MSKFPSFPISFDVLSCSRFVSCFSNSIALAQDTVVSTEINAAGLAVYDETCATCHAMPVETKSPPIETLQRMGPRAVRYALTNGKMRVQAAAWLQRILIMWWHICLRLLILIMAGLPAHLSC